MVFKNILFKGEPIITAEQIADRFYTYDLTFSFHNRLEKLKNWLLKKVKELEKTEWSKDWVQEEIELLSDED